VLEHSLVPPPLLADWGATTAIAVAFIAAVGSLIATVIGQVLARRTSKDLAKRTSILEQEGKERDARRDYEYEAKKRLYEECEPLLFQTVELAENARDRIASFARSSRSRDLEADGSGWLAQPGYYFTSTAFQLLAPMTSFKIVQRRLTVIDLSLEPQIREQYEILKLLFLSYTRDFDLAGREPVLRYEPDKADPGKPDRVRLLSEEPAVFGRQGLYRGTLDVVVDALIRTVGETSEDGKGDRTERCKTFGEFLAEFEASGSAVDRIRPELDELFAGFHPLRRPVLWRVLVAQALLYDAFLGVRSDFGELASRLDYRSADIDESAEDTATTLRIASSYVEPELARIKGLVARAP
jgi:hypothetical protein